jgi:hypothetical protein
MKTAISIPDALFAAAERLAGQLGVSRSELYREALGAFLREHSQEGVTEALNAVYGPDGCDSRIDPAVASMQLGSLGGEEW